MNKTTALRALVAGAGVAAAGAMGMAVASADDGTQQVDLGGAAQLTNGGTVQQWTVDELEPSSDAIPYRPAGRLWEAEATNTSLAGGNLPFVPGFSARGGADSYPALWGVASPEGINPGGLAPGQSAKGHLYFDVTGVNPDHVVFSEGGQDVAVWITPPPASASGGGAPAAVHSPPANYGVAQPAAVAPTAPAPAAAPAPASGSQGTPLPAAGNQGTPMPATGSQGTPLPAGTTPAPASTAPASPPATASQAPASAPAAASQAPASTPAPASQAPASPSTAAPASGSQGTPLTAPTTTVVPAPAA